MIAKAIAAKGVAKTEVAAHFGVKPPSVQGWINTGRIDKRKLEELWRYFSDVTTPADWGLAAWPWLDQDHSQPAPNTVAGLLAQIAPMLNANEDLRHAVLELASVEPIEPGQNQASFKPDDIASLLSRLKTSTDELPPAVKEAAAGLMARFLTSPPEEAEATGKAIEALIQSAKKK